MLNWLDYSYCCVHVNIILAFTIHLVNVELVWNTLHLFLLYKLWASSSICPIGENSIRRASLEKLNMLTRWGYKTHDRVLLLPLKKRSCYWTYQDSVHKAFNVMDSVQWINTLPQTNNIVKILIFFFGSLKFILYAEVYLGKPLKKQPLIAVNLHNNCWACIFLHNGYFPKKPEDRNYTKWLWWKE